MKPFQAIKLFFVLAAAIVLNNANAQNSAKKSADKTAAKEAGLKDAYKNHFFIGAALNAAQIEDKNADAALLIPKQFNSITSENIMKSEIIHPEWDKYNFDLADIFLA